MYESFSFSTFLQHYYFDYSQCEVVSLCGFDMHSSNDYLFLFLLDICISSLENFYPALLLIFNWVIGFLNYWVVIIFFIYSGYSLLSDMICKYYVPF